ncbi:MAG: hypothetical protein M1838_003205 [Thelocarpon superellum]|nr:MAG: hypothetical protein M1838_003205 [Thelocarpon superellum]
MSLATPTLDNFLSSVYKLLQSKDAVQLRRYLLVEPPLPDIYSMMITELRQAFPAPRAEALSRKCETLLPENVDRRPEDEVGSPWPGFLTFMKEYLEYLREVNVENLLETHQLLSSLTNQCITSLSNASMGLVVLPTCLSLSATLARLAMGLDKRPELTAHLIRRKSMVDAGDDSESKQTLVEGTAELLQRPFTICLTDRTASGTGIGRDGRPEGKKVGIYLFANLVLKLLFQCQKTRLASQIFTNISQHSPPLASFPASQRVTYLYYLGRFAFSNNHFTRAQTTLQAAHDQCQVQGVRQRRLILIYLISSNIILGRFPTTSLLQQPEARGLGPKFWPLCQAIGRGDLAGFIQSLEGEHHQWFLARGILLPLRNRCEVLVWRTLARKTYVMNGVPGGESRRAPTFSLYDFLHLARFLQQRSQSSSSRAGNALTNGRVHINSIFLAAPAPESRTSHAQLSPDPDLVDGDQAESESESESDLSLPSMLDVESILASLIAQGLLHGFLSHKLLRFAILGSKSKGALSAGFPAPWSVLKPREDQAVPGWVKEESRAPMMAGRAVGPGMVVNLSGARPAGAFSA